MKVHLSNFHPSIPLVKLLFAAASILIILTASVFVFSHKEVTVKVDGRVQRLVTRADTVGQLLAEADIDTSAHDQVAPGMDSKLDPGDQIVVNRAVPVALDVNGNRRRIWTVAKTVGAVIESDLGIALSADITFTPEAETRLTANRTIELKLLSRWTEKKRTEIPFAVRRRDNNRLAKGQTKLIEPGRAGVKETVIEHVTAGGREVETIVRGERVVSEPADRIVSIGTMVERVQVAAAPAPNLSREGRKMTMLATAYAANTGGAGSRTATGTGVYRGIVAVDPRVIPLGTRLYIDGYGPAVAADTGGVIKGNRIDLGFGSAGEAIQFGRRSVVVHVQ